MLERRTRDGKAVMYLVKIFNKPHRIVTLEVRHTFLILLPIKYVAKFIMKPRRGDIEAPEFLHGRGTV